MALLVMISVFIIVLFLYWVFFLFAGNIEKGEEQLKKEQADRLAERDQKEILVGRFESPVSLHARQVFH